MGQLMTRRSRNNMDDEIVIPLWNYDGNRKRWQETRINNQFHGDPISEFQVLTYNVWFANKYQPMRFENLCDVLNKSQAHVIGLQEMTIPVLSELINQKFVQDNYFLSDIDGRTFRGWYGVILLISNKLCVDQLIRVDFPRSAMERCLILVDILLSPDQLLRIGTVHLESLASGPQRSEQLTICKTIFQRRSPATSILMGDFNFPDTTDENQYQFSLLENWIDVWNHLIDPNQYRLTFDTETNLMAKRSNHGDDQSRYDRIILQSSTVKPTQIEIIGKQLIGHWNDLPIFISDHFGLTARFQVKLE